MVLCGPPGSGKTMTLFSALWALPDFEVSLNLTITCYMYTTLRVHLYVRGCWSMAIFLSK